MRLGYHKSLRAARLKMGVITVGIRNGEGLPGKISRVGLITGFGPPKCGLKAGLAGTTVEAAFFLHVV